MSGLPLPAVPHQHRSAQPALKRCADSRYAWPPLIAGSLTALVTAWVFCQLPPPNKLSLTALFLTSVGYVSVTILAGGMGVWALIPLRTKSPLESGVLALDAGVGWAWLPAIVLLFRHDSMWTLVVTSVASAAMAACVRNAIASQTVLQDRVDDRRWRARIISACWHGAMIAVLVRSILTASVLLAVSGFASVWHLTSTGVYAVERKKGPAAWRFTWVAAFAILITSVALLPQLRNRRVASEISSLLGLSETSRETAASERHSQSATSKPSYESIILWTVRKEKKTIASLAPRTTLLPVGKSSNLMVIPFDGSYWYFKEPNKSPGPKAHLAHGSPLTLDIHSADWLPLVMEAHQDIGSSVDLACCSEIQVAIKNANNQPGTIFLGVILKDSALPGKPMQYLGVQPVVSSEAGHFSIKPVPVDEVLKFPVPTRPKIPKFDEIIVAVFPAMGSSVEGAKIAIQQFALLPR